MLNAPSTNYVARFVARLALQDGASVIATDINARACEQARDLGVKVVSGDELLTGDSDIFVPCALGGVIDLEFARSIRTRAVAGAANNLLRTDDAGDELARRGIALAPDFIANAGGAIHLVGREVLGWSADEVSARVEAIGATLGDVFASARREKTSTQRAALALAASRLLTRRDHMSENPRVGR